MVTDLRYALRSLRKNPGFTGIAALTLALGIGANTAIFSVIDGVLLRPAPVANIGRLVMVWETDRSSGTTREPSSVPDYLDFGQQSRAVAQFGAFAPTGVTLTPDDGTPSRLDAFAVTHDYFTVLGIGPLVGRVFGPEEDHIGGPRAVMISEGLWDRLYARDPEVVGRAIRLFDTPYTIVGVLPASATFGTRQILGAAAYQRGFADQFGRVDVDVWVPLQPDPRSSPRTTHPIFVLGRLAEGNTATAAQQELTAIAGNLEQTYPENAGRGVFIEPFAQVVFGPVRPALFVLLAAVALVLLVACVNVANLLLARGMAREREVALRTAVGARQGRLARQFIAEGVTLSAMGALAGVLLAIGGTWGLLRLAPGDIPRLTDVGVNGRVLAITLLVTCVVGVVFGLIPTLQARSVDLQASLKSESSGSVSTSVKQGRVRSALVVAELALAVTLVIGAGLLIKSLWRLQRVDAGFQAAGLLKVQLQLPRNRYPVDFAVWPNFKEMHAFNDEVLRRTAALPGVAQVAIAGNHPLDAGFTNSFTVVGREAEAQGWPEISVRRVTPDYFRTVELPVERGRVFQTSDDAAAVPVALVNAAAARRFFENQDPIGQQIRMWGASRTIVGVVGDERFHGLAEGAPPAVYYPLAQAPSADGNEAVLIRSNVDPAGLAASVRAVLQEVDPAVPAFGVEPLTETVSNSMGQQRFLTLVLGLFAAVAILLALIGIHGVLSYVVARRSREMGLRMALGATGRDVVGLMIRRGAGMVVVGLGLGLATGLATSRILRGLLFGVSATDPLTFIVVGAVVFGAALLATWLPARRATRVDPMEALRYE